MTAREKNSQGFNDEHFSTYGKAAIFAPLIIGGAIVAGTVMMWQTHNRNVQLAEMCRIEEETRIELRTAYAHLRALQPEEALKSTEKADSMIRSLNIKLAPDYASLKVYLLLVEAEAYFMKECATHADLAEQKFDQALGLMNYASGDLWLFGMLGRARTRFEQGKYEQALQDLNSVMDRNPSFGAAYYWRALTREHLGDEDGASEDEKKARSLDSWPPLRDYIQSSCRWTRDIIHMPKKDDPQNRDSDMDDVVEKVADESEGVFAIPPPFFVSE